MAAVAVAWRSSVVWLCVLLSVLSVSPWLLVAVSGQSACLADANQYFLGSTSGAVQVISPTAAFDLTGHSPTAGPGNMIDNNLNTAWIPSGNSQNNYGAYFQFAADGLSTAYLVVGYSISVYPTSNPGYAYSFEVGISQQATDNINQTQEVATINVPQSTTANALTFYVWVKNPFISDGASVVGEWTPNQYNTQAKVVEVRFFVVPVIPLTGSSDPQGHAGCTPLQNVQSTIDGTGLSFWNPGCGGSATYVESLSTYTRSGQNFNFQGVLLQTIYDGAHSPTSFTLTTSGQQPVSWNVVNYGLSPAYGVYAAPATLSLAYGATASVQYTMAQYQPYIRQIAIIGTGTPLPSLLPVYSPGCIWSNSSIQQFYARYNAAVGVMTHTLAWDQTDTDNLFNFWLTKPVQLHLIPACFPYPYLPNGDTTAATLFAAVAPRSAASYDHQWTVSSPLGLDQAWGVACHSCSGTQLFMYNYLNSFVQARTTITGRLQRDLSIYWDAYYTNRLADINAITDFFDGPNTQFNINTFVLIQKELNTLASAKDSPLGIITDVLGVIGAALPGLGVVFSSFADVATGVAAAVSTASTLSTLGQDIASGSGLSGGSPITTPFDALGGAGYLMSPIACQSGACTNDLYFGQMLQEVTAQSTAGAESVTPFVQRVLANYGQTMFFNAWYQGYDNNNALYPTSVLNSLLQNEASTSASWQAALGVRAMYNAFSFGSGTNSQNVQYCYVNALSGSGYPVWSSSSWNGLRSVFSSSPLKSTFWLASPPVTINGGCSGSTDSNQCYANCNQAMINQLTNQIVPNALVAGADPLFQSSIGAPAATTAQTQQCTYS